MYTCYYLQLFQAKSGKINPHVHVEYEWNLRQEEMDESDDDLDDKVSGNDRPLVVLHSGLKILCGRREGLGRVILVSGLFSLLSLSLVLVGYPIAAVTQDCPKKQLVG